MHTHTTHTHTGARRELDLQRKRLDAARTKYALLRRKMEGEFATLDTMAEKVAELEALRKVGVEIVCARGRI